MPTAGVVEGLDGATRLIVSGGWSDAAVAALSARSFDRVEFHGGEYEDFGFLAPFAANIVSLALPSGAWASARGLEALTSLRTLALGSPLEGVDFSRLENLRGVSLGAWSKAYGRSLFECRRLEWLHVEGFADEDCTRIARLPALASLSLARGRLESLAGLRHCTSLRALQLAHLRRLADVAEVASLQALRELELVEALPKVDDLQAITHSERLRRLDLRGVDCRFDDLAWLKRMTRLHVLGLRNVARPDWDCLFASRELKKAAITFEPRPRFSVDDVRAVAIGCGLNPTSIKPLGVPQAPSGFVVEFRPEGSTANLWFWRDPDVREREAEGV